MSKKMKRTDQGKVAPEIWMGIDLSNSLNGGSSHIETHIQPSDVGYEGFIRVPGVDIDEISVEVIQNRVIRSEEHTSELQSRENLVCRLLLEKKKKKKK